MTVVFRVAAGPRVGFGHLVRCRSLARILGVAPRVSIRGTADTRRRAASLGWHVLPARVRDLAAWRPSVLVVDDPSATAAARWVAAARRLGIPVASVHDVGSAPVASHLSIDGSVGRTADCGTQAALRGPSFAILDPGVAEQRRLRRHGSRRVLVAIGGGASARGAVAPLVAALVAARPDLDVHVAGGFLDARRERGPVGGRLVAGPSGLAGELAGAAVAVVAGGVTLYEACALGVPAVAAAVTSAQRETVRAVAREGAAVDGGYLRTTGDAKRLARAVVALIDAPARRRALGQRGRALVDARGGWRVAAALRRLARTVERPAAMSQGRSRRLPYAA